MTLGAHAARPHVMAFLETSLYGTRAAGDGRRLAQLHCSVYLEALAAQAQAQAQAAQARPFPHEARCVGWRACQHAQPGAPPVRCHQLPEGHSTYELSKVDTRHKYVDTSICSGLTLELTHTQVREWTRPDALALHASEFTLPDQDAFEAALVD